MDWDDLNAEKRRGYSHWHCYANSKLANVLHAKELARRAKDVGIVAFSVHPGSSEMRIALKIATYNMVSDEIVSDNVAKYQLQTSVIFLTN